MLFFCPNSSVICDGRQIIIETEKIEIEAKGFAITIWQRRLYIPIFWISYGTLTNLQHTSDAVCTHVCRYVNFVWSIFWFVHSRIPIFVVLFLYQTLKTSPIPVLPFPNPLLPFILSPFACSHIARAYYIPSQFTMYWFSTHIFFVLCV